MRCCGINKSAGCCALRAPESGACGAWPAAASRSLQYMARRRLLTRLCLLTRTDKKRMANVPAVPAGEGPIRHNLGVHNHLDVDTEERYGLEILKLVVADLPQQRIRRLRIRRL